MKFKDLEGFIYEYDNISGIIHEIHNDEGFIDLNSDKIRDVQTNRINSMNNIILRNSKKIDAEKLTEQYYIDNGIKQLTFKLTDQCNMRCKYCAYSDYYPFTQKYENKFLKIDDAIKGVDIYMDFIEKHNSIWTNVEINPTFTFYGGEPLLQFNIIKQIVEYIEIKYSKYNPKYLMTTNALLINDEVAKFIKKHNFHVSISLDGYIENHNRNRINSEGKGTFEKIDIIIRKYLLDYNNWNIFMCYDFRPDFEKLMDHEAFGLGNDYFYDHIAKITLVSDVNTNYYEQFSKKEYQNYVYSMKKFRESFVKKMLDGEKLNFLEKIFFEYDFIMLQDRSKFTANNGFYEVPLGNCIPGDKLFLQTDGTFTLCEKVPDFHEFIIGNVNIGIDINKIRTLINKVNQDVLVNCKNCEISRLCPVCYATLFKDENDNFKVDKKICNGQKDIIKMKMSIYVSLMKEKKDMFNYFYIDKYLKS